MITLAGVALSPGMARGTAVMVRAQSYRERSGPEDARTAQEKFRQACRAAEAELGRALEALGPTDGPARQILRAHLTLVSDPMLAAAVESHILHDAIGAYAAVERAAATLSARFDALADPVMRQRAADVRDVCECISRHLAGWTPPSGGAANAGCVVCAEELSPAQVIQLAQDRPAAFVLEHGAETSHAAILMRALAVPAVIGVPDLTTLVKVGDLVLVDGNRARVLVGPEASMSVAAPAATSAAVDESDAQPASTSDGVAIAVTATIADAADARRAMAAGADGIGLLRSEMLFLRSGQLPSEQAQEAFYREVAAAIGSRPLTIRLLDLGADKQSPALHLPPEPNPALGLRGVRLLLAHPELFIPHLRALLRARAGRIRVLVPMVVDVTDVTRVRELIDEASRAVVPAVCHVDIGAMVETPAAALMADELATAVDFMSVGTNDLAQYVLAADRDSARMAPFYQPLHPAVLRLVRGVVAAAARRGVPVSVCGETAADPRAIPLFVGMGVTELSVRPSAVAGVKAQVRRISRAETGIDVRETCNPR